MSSIEEAELSHDENVTNLIHDLSKSDISTKKSILDLSNEEACDYFLKATSYCNFDLPTRYIVFDKLLDDVNEILSKESLFEPLNRDKILKGEKEARNNKDVNYTILNNKDGKYAWRSLELINPVLYVSLVRKITEEKNWRFICDRFSSFQKNEQTHCLSLPVISVLGKKDKAEQILHWWEEIEQRSIALSLEYEYLLETDITDCYGSIYTHSIVWALHGKKEARDKRCDKNLIGNVIDSVIQTMRHGQTNGIPQGSTLMDFIAEMVLGYADSELSERLPESIKDYCILRYRDDYRIFVNNPRDGEKILKLLTEVLISLSLKPNPSKTKVSNQVIRSSIKNDKLAWIMKKERSGNSWGELNKHLQKDLLIIHDHAYQFPNAGSLLAPLKKYYDRLFKFNKPIEEIAPLISIIVDIAYHNPKAYPICASIISRLIDFLEEGKKEEIIQKIKTKFEHIPHTGHLEIWLQRITFKINKNISYNETICKLVSSDKNIPLWNVNWIAPGELKDIITKTQNIINREELNQMSPVIQPEEVALFRVERES